MNYFEPKKFEEFRGKSVYEFLGVRFFKKYLLLTDLAMFKLRGRKQISISNRGLAKELERIEWQTRRDEVIHIVFMGIIVLMFLNIMGTCPYFS